MVFSKTNLLELLKFNYPSIGKVTSVEFLKKGNEGSVYDVCTLADSKYILKIYKSGSKIKRLLKVEKLCKDAKFPCTETILSNSYGSLIEWNKKIVLYKKFEGEIIDNPQLEDINQIASHLSNLHSSVCNGAPKFKKYWSLLNLQNIYKRYNKFFPTGFSFGLLLDQLLNKQNFPICLLHGDLHKFNILKNAKNEYCFLDLGCCGEGPRILDVVQLVADFVIDSNSLEKTNKKINEFFVEYKPKIKLTIAEKNLFTDFLESYFAMFVARDAYLLQKNSNDSVAQYWHKNALVGLEMSKNLQITF